MLWARSLTVGRRPDTAEKGVQFSSGPHEKMNLKEIAKFQRQFDKKHGWVGQNFVYFLKLTNQLLKVDIEREYFKKNESQREKI